MVRSILTALISVCLVLGAVFFVLYGRARMRENTPKEKLYLKLHFIFLSVVIILGVVWLLVMVETAS